LESTVDLMEVVYGERMEYAVNAAIPNTYVQISGETFGSGNPIATNKLHWTRLAIFSSPAASDIGALFATNLVVQVISTEEKELVWMERLRRSYVLQGRNI